jgi:hypothetical protein
MLVKLESACDLPLHSVTKNMWFHVLIQDKVFRIKFSCYFLLLHKQKCQLQMNEMIVVKRRPGSVRATKGRVQFCLLFFFNETSVDTEMCCPKGKCRCQYFISLTLKKKKSWTQGSWIFLIKN